MWWQISKTPQPKDNYETVISWDIAPRTIEYIITDREHWLNTGALFLFGRGYNHASKLLQ